MMKEKGEKGKQKRSKTDLDHQREANPVRLGPHSRCTSPEYRHYGAEADESDRDLSNREKNVSFVADASTPLFAAPPPGLIRQPGLAQCGDPAADSVVRSIGHARCFDCLLGGSTRVEP